MRLDDEAEAALRQIRDRTGLPISEALKRGLRSLQKEINEQPTKTPYEIYKSLGPIPGGNAIAPASNYKTALREKLLRKHGLRRKLGR